MYPVLFRVAGFFIPAYLVAQLLALLVGAGWLQLRRRDLELPPSVGLDMALLGFAAVFLGGRLESLRRGTSALGGLAGLVSPSGFAFFGVLFLAMLGAALYARYHQRPVLFIWDAMAPAIPLALVPYRLGCLLAGCCHGTQTELPWGIHYPESWLYFEAGVALHPVPVYEMLLGLACFGLLRGLQLRPDRRLGDVTLAFVLVMAPMRFLTDLFREDAVLRIAPWSEAVLLTQAQWWCLFGTVLALVVLAWRGRPRWPGAQSSEATKSRT